MMHILETAISENICPVWKPSVARCFRGIDTLSLLVIYRCFSRNSSAVSWTNKLKQAAEAARRLPRCFSDTAQQPRSSLCSRSHSLLFSLPSVHSFDRLETCGCLRNQHLQSLRCKGSKSKPGKALSRPRQSTNRPVSCLAIYACKYSSVF